MVGEGRGVDVGVGRGRVDACEVDGAAVVVAVDRTALVDGPIASAGRLDAAVECFDAAQPAAAHADASTTARTRNEFFGGRGTRPR